MPDSLDCIQEEIRRRIGDHQIGPIAVHSSVLKEMMRRGLFELTLTSPDSVYTYMGHRLIVDDREKPFSVARNPFRDNNMTARAQYMKDNPEKWKFACEAAGLNTPFDQYPAVPSAQQVSVIPLTPQELSSLGIVRRKKHRPWLKKVWTKCRWQLRAWRWEYGWGDW